MSVVRFIPNINRLAKAMMGPGGKPQSEAISDAEAAVQILAPPGVEAIDTQAVTTGSNADYNTAVQSAVKQGCWLNVANRNDAMVFHTWMKGVNAAHVVAMPWALLLNQLYPG